MTERFRISARYAGRVPIRDEDFLTLDGVDVADEVYGPRKLTALSSIGSRFERCSFAGLSIEDAGFGSGKRRSDYVECTFDGSSLRSPALGSARFVRCSFRDVHLSQWRSEADFIDCVFTGEARDCVFRGVAEDPITGERLRTAAFSGNDFRGMELRDVAFRGGIDLRRQRLPSGEPYVYLEHARRSLKRARRVLNAWEDEARRTEALETVAVLEDERVVHAQPQLHFRIDELEADPVTQRALLDALASGR